MLLKHKLKTMVYITKEYFIAEYIEFKALNDYVVASDYVMLIFRQAKNSLKTIIQAVKVNFTNKGRILTPSQPYITP